MAYRKQGSAGADTQIKNEAVASPSISPSPQKGEGDIFSPSPEGEGLG